MGGSGWRDSRFPFLDCCYSTRVGLLQEQLAASLSLRKQLTAMLTSESTSVSTSSKSSSLFDQVRFDLVYCLLVKSL